MFCTQWKMNHDYSYCVRLLMYYLFSLAYLQSNYAPFSHFGKYRYQSVDYTQGFGILSSCMMMSSWGHKTAMDNLQWKFVQQFRVEQNDSLNYKHFWFENETFITKISCFSNNTTTVTFPCHVITGGVVLTCTLMFTSFTVFSLFTSCNLRILVFLID